MKKNMMQQNLHQSIKRSLARYIAIVAIIALGAGMFVGLRTTKSDMIATARRYMDEQNMFDLRLLSTYGWSKSDVDVISAMDGVVDAEGVITMDMIAGFDGTDDENVYKVFSIPEKVNQIFLHGGRMPQSPDECIIDAFYATDEVLGKKIVVSDSNTDSTMEQLNYHSYTIVGYASTPLYMDMSRGNTTLGNGSVSALLFLPKDSFSIDYYMEIDVTISVEGNAYTDNYHDAVQLFGERISEELKPTADNRYQIVLSDAKEAYNDGLEEYQNGLAEYNKAKSEVEKELREAKKKLEDGEKELAEKRKLIEQSIPQLEEGQKQIDEARKQLSDGKVALANAKAEAFSQLAAASGELMSNYKLVNNNLNQVNEGISQINSGISQIDSGISQLETGLSTLETMIGVGESMLNIAKSSLSRAEQALEQAKENGTDADVIAELETAVMEAKAQVAEYETQLSDMKQQKTEYTTQLEQLRVQRESLIEQRSELEAAKAELEAALDQIDLGFRELQSSQAQAENEFAAAEAKLEASEIQLNSAQAELDKTKKEIEEGLKLIEDGEKELKAGWEEYYKGEETSKNELASAKEELDEAKKKLDEANEEIMSMGPAEVYALGRTSNVGYLAFESNAQIVQGVSTVFPAFFLLIAALVCITTMTRMVEEERTQIGTLKAMGYSNGSIVSKYLVYAGSAAVVGCGLGVIIGSVVFPTILWEVYQIIIMLGDYLVLQIDWPLCLVVVGLYTIVTLLVTWFCCRMSLREVPAELIRPKAPAVGKKILLEQLPFWNKFSFLNKVMLRNIFRYKQRLLMMIVGIGGCTALLLTGFGISDSIKDLANAQFTEVILYDMEARFGEGLSTEEQEAFVAELNGQTDGVYFYHQSSMELLTKDSVKDVTILASDGGLASYVDFHDGNTKLQMPGRGEALISIGAAERMNINVGDIVQVRDSDMRILELKVSGIFDNNVYNYVVVSLDTIIEQWDEMPAIQMACINSSSNTDIHELGARISEMDNVMSVTINQDIQESVGSMLQALDLIVVTVVICAGLLAVIVLYNLTNINITERIREIATIKVLGFTDIESAAYVFKENLLLSAMGALIGLVGGVFLLEFVMSQITVDMVWMSARIMPISFVWSLLITMLSALIVDFALYFRLNKINMAEALKSVE